jgi:hypothetical protein
MLHCSNVEVGNVVNIQQAQGKIADHVAAMQHAACIGK